MLQRTADIVAVAHPTLRRVGGDERRSGIVDNHAREQARIPGVDAAAMLMRVIGELLLDAVPYGAVDDGRVLARIAQLAVRDLADINRVGEQLCRSGRA